MLSVPKILINSTEILFDISDITFSLSSYKISFLSLFGTLKNEFEFGMVGRLAFRRDDR